MAGYRPIEDDEVLALREALAKTLVMNVSVERPQDEERGEGEDGWDATVRVGKETFRARFLRASARDHIFLGNMEVSHAISKLPRGTHRMLVVPYMKEPWAKLCEEFETNWADLSGNARIVVPGLVVRVLGKKGRAKPVGRPENVFATKSERITHLLLRPENELGILQKHLAKMSGLGPGYVSRIIKRLENLLLVQKRNGAIIVRDKNRLLDAWWESHEFPMRSVVAGVIPARSSSESMARLHNALTAQGIRHAFTGLSAASILAPFANFRIVTCYMEGSFTPEMRKEVGFDEGAEGANAWVVENADPGVFFGDDQWEAELGIKRGHFPTVGPLLTYVDLKHHPERAKEAAEHLREKLLRWEL